jgi:hypothetical protein
MGRKTETLVLAVKYEGPAADFAWIVPLPAKPDVKAIDADKNPFAEISVFTQFRQQFDGGAPRGGGPCGEAQADGGFAAAASSAVARRQASSSLI